MTENEEIKFETKINKADYRRLVYFTALFKSKFKLAFFITAGVISAIVIFTSRLGFFAAPAYLFYTSIAYLGLLALYFVSIELIIKKFLSSDKIAIGSSRTVTISDQFIKTSGGEENCQAEYKWDMIYHAYKTKLGFLLYVNIQQAFIFPYRDLSENDISALEKLLAQKLGKKFEIRK